MIFNYIESAMVRSRLLFSAEAQTAAGKRRPLGLYRPIFEILVSLATLTCSFYGIIWADSEPGTKQLLAGFAGSVIGYWLRPE